GQVVATDAGERAAALGYLGRGIMRAARAKIRRAGKWHDVAAELAFLRLQEIEALGDARRGVEPGDKTGDRSRDLGRGTLAVGRQNPIVVLMELADDSREHVPTPVIKLVFELVLDDCALFFHTEDLFPPL